MILGWALCRLIEMERYKDAIQKQIEGMITSLEKADVCRGRESRLTVPFGFALGAASRRMCTAPCFSPPA
jgi:hypothetical protein